MLRLVSIAFVCACAVWVLPGRARADVLTEFDAAQMAYREQRYAMAATILEGVIATAANNPADQAIVLESRKYLAACYLFLERPDDADGQFVLLLELDPTYRVDPATFPREFVDRFEDARRRVEAERMAELQAQLALTQARLDEQRADIELERHRYRSLYDFASESLVVRRNSRWLAILPFGVGQFQNRHARRGRWFAVTEGIALGGYLAGYIWRRRIEDVDPGPMARLEWERQIRSSLAVNWSSGLAFLTLAIAGAVEAETNFVPTFESTRRRPVPTQLEPIEPSVEASVSISPFGANLQLRF